MTTATDSCPCPSAHGTSPHAHAPPACSLQVEELQRESAQQAEAGVQAAEAISQAQQQLLEVGGMKGWGGGGALSSWAEHAYAGEGTGRPRTQTRSALAFLPHTCICPHVLGAEPHLSAPEAL